MLILTRKIGERLTIGEDIVVVVSKVRGNRVTIGVDAPQSLRILREEVAEEIKRKESNGND